jgi:hypothetical protein
VGIEHLKKKVSYIWGTQQQTRPETDSWGWWDKTRDRIGCKLSARGWPSGGRLHAATRARRLLALTAAGLPSSTESHPMDHDSISSGHTKTQA